MKKILLIANYRPGTGGISVQVEILQKQLLAEGVPAAIFNTKGSILFRLLSFIRLIKTGQRYDVFHIHGCSYLGFYPVVLGILVGKILNKRLIVTYHGGDGAEFFRKYPRFVRFFLSRTHTNIVLSDFLGVVFRQHNIPYLIIPNILEVKDNQFIHRDKISPHYISVRSLIEIYNVRLIIDAFERVLTVYPEATLTIIGDGSSRPSLEELVKDKKIKNISFVGWVTNNQIYEHLKKADIFVSASFVDNQPVSILEAFNAGVLVISSRVGGVPYLVDENHNGYLFESNNLEELTTKMILAVENQQESLSMIAAANKSLEMYKWENIKPKILELYN